jgi:ribosomal protein L11 methylase PrmA
MADNPTNYKPNLPRVSSIVEFAFPFIWEKKDRFLNWLEEKGVSLEDYMEEACVWGTYVHKAMEDYSNWKKPKKKKYTKIIEAGIRFHEEHKLETIGSEVYVSTKDYQGTVDRLCYLKDLQNEWPWIIDWKTYWLAKDKFGISSTYRKPYDKLKKAQLQLSLYAYAIGYKNIGVVELTNDWFYYFHPLSLLPKREINKIIKEYKLRYADEI